jgi:hypothetical protein
MACERFRDALSEHAAGEPAAPELGAHLPECEGCRLELEGLRRALALADAELGNLLSAVPSPELAARIRTAVARDPAAPAWRPGFWPSLAAAAAALLAVVGLVALRDEPSRSRAAATQAQRAPEALEKPAPPSPPEARTLAPKERGALVRAALPSPRRVAQAPAVEPEVLVPADQAEALLRFAAGLRQRSLAPGSLLVADLNAPLPEARDVQIRPLEIVPLGPEEDTGTE